MVRRVGFGDDAATPARRRGDDTPTPPPNGAAGAPRGGSRLFVGAFLAFWLAAWSVAIAFAANQIMAEGLGAAETFLFIWVGVAAVFWLLAAHMLWRVLTGRPLSSGRRRNWGRTPVERGGVRRGDWDHGAHD